VRHGAGGLVCVRAVSVVGVVERGGEVGDWELQEWVEAEEREGVPRVEASCADKEARKLWVDADCQVLGGFLCVAVAVLVPGVEGGPVLGKVVESAVRGVAAAWDRGAKAEGWSAMYWAGPVVSWYMAVSQSLLGTPGWLSNVKWTDGGVWILGLKRR